MTGLPTRFETYDALREENAAQAHCEVAWKWIDELRAESTELRDELEAVYTKLKVANNRLGFLDKQVGK